MNGVSIGRIVWYFPPTEDGSVKKAQPAMIVNVWNDEGLVNLSVFPDGTNDEHPQRDNSMNHWATSVKYSEIPQSNSWCWPTKS